MSQAQIQERLSRIIRSIDTATKKWLKLAAEAGTTAATWVKKTIKRLGRPASTFRAFPFWIAAAIAGVTSVAYAQLFHLAEELMDGLYGGAPWALLLISPLCFLLGWWIVNRFSPEASGSGIPQVMASNMLFDLKLPKRADRLVAPRVAVIKVISSLLCLIGGGAIGREGPTIQISASIFRSIGIFSRKFIPPVTDQAWITAGGAAGIAAAFNTPLGGIVFALEELMTSHFSRLRTTVISSVILAGFVAQLLLGPYLYLGFPRVGGTDLLTLPLALFVGIVSGIGGGLFSRYLFVLVRKRAALKSFRQQALLTVGASLVVIILAVWVDGRAVGSGSRLMAGLLFQGEQAGFLLIVVRFISTIASYLSGCAGGIFAPSLAIGASIGSSLSQLVPAEYTNLMTLMGMIGFLSAVTRAPFTSFVLVLEMTDRHSVIFPMMIAAVSGFSIARTFDSKSFYEHMKEIYIGKIPAQTEKS